MSPSSSSSSRNVEHPKCWCPEGILAKQCRSNSDENPARRFYNCSKSLISKDHCKFFKWIDPPLNQDYKDHISKLNMRIEQLENNVKLEQLENNVKLEKLHRKVEKHKALRLANKEKYLACISDLELEITDMKRKMRLKIYLPVFCVFVMVVFVVYLLVIH